MANMCSIRRSVRHIPLVLALVLAVSSPPAHARIWLPTGPN